MRKIVTTYINPDMDGISLMYAYTELLRKKREKADYYFEGTMKKEAEIVLNKFNIKLNTATRIENEDKIVLVDTNYLTEIPKAIEKENIVEIIDHHNKDSWLNDRNDIKIQIELIGAAATLVAERFKNENIKISRESAILLYYGIISNTMNLKIKLTSQKDIEMANWLKQQTPEITDEITTQIFVEKSQIGDSLREEMEVEFKDQFMSISWSMGQLEVANVDEFLNKYEQDIRNVLKTVSEEKNVEYISVNCMDIINGYSVIVAGNEKTAEIISNTIGLNFKDLKAKTNELVSRKEIVKVMRELYKNGG
ncbi:MAG: DHH family phosphoesterase [Clostridia bacterium]|nr:DHH family phosphoesterase [Clostridia bacterium]